jgi:hypothetical protein
MRDGDDPSLPARKMHVEFLPNDLGKRMGPKNPLDGETSDGNDQCGSRQTEGFLQIRRAILHFLRCRFSVPFPMFGLTGIALRDSGDMRMGPELLFGHANGGEPLKKPFAGSPSEVLLGRWLPNTRRLADEEETSPEGGAGPGHGTIATLGKTLGAVMDGTTELLKVFFEGGYFGAPASSWVSFASGPPSSWTA